MTNGIVSALAKNLSLGSLLEAVRHIFGTYDLVDHRTQGEFHHDVVLKVPLRAAIPGPYLVVATNCNGGVKEVMCFSDAPAHGALWHWRCPDVEEFNGELPPLHARAITQHWFDPCELLRPDARSELRPEFRERQEGGGWRMIPTACGKPRK